MVRAASLLSAIALLGAAAPAAAQVSFSSTAYPVPSSPRTLATADFDRDGDLDLAVGVNEVGGIGLAVLLGDGAGGFGPAKPLSSRPGLGVAAGDLDGDGRADLAATHGDGTVSVRFGDGAGGFGAPKDYPVGAGSRFVAIADVSGDRHPDLVVPNDQSNTVSVLLYGGAREFGATTHYQVGSRPFAVAVGDLNTDGRPDLVVANHESRDVSVLLGIGGGGFRHAPSFDAGGSAWAVALGDLDGDGKLDVALSAKLGAQANDMSILLGNGAGGFGPPTVYSLLGGVGEGIVVRDLDGDGDPDVAIAGTTGNSVFYALNDGAGTFAAGGRTAVNRVPRGLVTADFNGDGRPDLATTNTDLNTVTVLLNTTGAASCDSALSPVGCWRFNETSGRTAFDSSPFDNDGTYLNGPRLGVPGVVPGDTAVSLDGVDDVVRVPDSPSLDVGDSFTLEGWILRDDANTTHQLFNKGSGGFQLVILERASGNRVLLRKAGGSAVARSAGGVPADGRYHHVVAVKDERRPPRIYIDGVEQVLQSSAPGQVIRNTASPLHLSAASRAGGAIRGDIDQFAVYDRALTADQVATLFAAGAP